MEEKETKVTELNSVKDARKDVKNPENTSMVPQEHVQQILQQAEGRMRQMVEQMRQMNQMLTDKTIDHLFDVVKHPTYFETEFVERCAKCIEEYITSVAFSTPEKTEEGNKEEK